MILKHKTTKEIEEFISQNKYVYPICLQKFLNCSYSTAKRTVKKIKLLYEIKDRNLESETFRKYVYECL